MKKFVLLLAAVLILLSVAGCSGKSDASEGYAADMSDAATDSVEETAASNVPKATVGVVAFAFDRDGEFFDIAYKYPGSMEYEKDEEAPRDLMKYLSDGYDPYAFAVEVSRTAQYSPDEVISGLLRFSPTVTSAEYNGVSWTVASDGYEESKSILYLCTLGDYTYILRFVTGYADSIDFAEFAEVFAQNVTVK